MPELVSILIPAYNADKWISQTINSALNQNWPNKEIIIVDDGSTDKTLRIAKTFESGTVKVVTQKNGGACVARNKALSIAQGDYIQWLDADDLLVPDKVKTQMKYSERGLESKILLTSSFGKFYFRPQKAIFKPNQLWKDLKPEEWIITVFTKNVWLNPTSWLVSRKLTSLAGLWDERLSLSGGDDGEYICRIVAKSEKVKFFRKAKCYYRIGNFGSLSWSCSNEALESEALGLSLMFDHLLQLEDSERTREACLSYLNYWFYHFYPNRIDLLEELADRLGGELKIQKTRLRYFFAEKILGYNQSQKLKSTITKIIETNRKNWDLLMYKLTSQ